MKRSSSRHGFSFIEVLIAASILTLTVGLVLRFFLSSLDMFGVSVGKLNVASDLRRLSQIVLQDCTRAQTITVVSGDQVTLSLRNGTTITYQRTGGTGIGEVRRTESATGRTSVVASRIRPPASGQFFSTINNDNSIHIVGRVSSAAKSLRTPEILNGFEFVVTRRG